MSIPIANAAAGVPAFRAAPTILSSGLKPVVPALPAAGMIGGSNAAHSTEALSHKLIRSGLINVAIFAVGAASVGSIIGLYASSREKEKREAMEFARQTLMGDQGFLPFAIDTFQKLTIVYILWAYGVPLANEVLHTTATRRLVEQASAALKPLLASQAP